MILTTFGNTFALSLCYLVTAQLFPTDLTTQAFGIVNIFANFSTIAAPLIAETEGAVPMLVFGITSLAAAAFSVFVNYKVKYD